MPSSFPFLRLPLLIQLLILKNASLLELFKLSLISKRSKQIVKSLDFTLSTLFWDFDDFVNWRELKLCDAQTHRLSISHRFELEEFIPSGEITFHGNVLPVYCKDTWDRLVIGNEMTMNASQELMEQFTKYFLDLINVSEYNLVLSSFSNLRDCFVWKYTKHFENLEVSDHRTLSSEDLKFVLEELTIEDWLSIGAFVEEGVEYSGPLKMRRLFTKDSNWLTLEAILNMDCEYLVLHRTTFTYQDLNAIIRKWMDGGLENLQEIIINNFVPVPGDSWDTALDHILEGIKTFAGNAESGASLKGRNMRRSDGVLAFTDSTCRDRFSFKVRHKPVISMTDRLI